MIAKNIKTLRKRNKLSQWKLAENLGVVQQAVSSWESEKNEPTIFSCIMIADYFGVTLDELCRSEIK